MARVLVVDDEIYMRQILVTNLKQDHHLLREASGVADVRLALSNGDFDVVITDHKMNDGNGMDVLKLLKQNDPSAAVIFLTAVGSIELAVESIKSGAFDFLVKPFLPEVLRTTVTRAAEHTRLLRENERLKGTISRLEGSSDIVGNSPAVQQLRREIAKVAPTHATVLITGETGTGKELVARSIHKSSDRSAAPFIAINCAALPDTLLESELFGHERGAFTGADRSKEGMFEAAQRGTLFLDEIAELSQSAQAKLLRAITEREIVRIGSTRPRSIDVRLIAATHRDLKSRVTEGTFREDLYYRISVYPIAIPPLRQRRQDLPELCEHFLRLAQFELKLPRRSLAASTFACLHAYDFPGNVRELRNLIERACIVSETQEIGPEALPLNLQLDTLNPVAEPEIKKWLSTLPDNVDLRGLLSSIEHDLVVRALTAAGGVQAEAARQLGISRSDLGYKLSRLQIKTGTE